TVETAAGEDCDTGIASGPGSCAAITCDDSIACSIDLPIYPAAADNGEPPKTANGPTGPGNACVKYCSHVPNVNGGTADSCCPPGATSSSDPDCKCGNGTTDGPASAPYEQCDDSNTADEDNCSTSCTYGHIAVGSPCTVAVGAAGAA